MTSFTALYTKEFREHRESLVVTFLVVSLTAFLPVSVTMVDVDVRHNPVASIWAIGFYVAAFYLMAIAAMSYAKEDETKTALFLRRLPTDGGTILKAKLAWLGTSILVLSIPPVLAVLFLCMNFMIFPFDMFQLEWQPVILCTVGLFGAISWGFFWTTRWPSKLFATLASGLSLIISFGILYWLTVILYVILSRKHDVDDEAVVLFCVFLTIQNTVILAFALRRAVRYYRMPENEAKALPEFDVDAKPIEKRRTRFITQFFPGEHWSPFQAMLWQSIVQSRDILWLGSLTVSLLILWQFTFQNSFEKYMNGASYDYNPLEKLYGAMICIAGMILYAGSFMVAFGFAATVFSQDRERDAYQFMTFRGVSPRLFWWSRVLPFAAIYMIPLFAYIAVLFSILGFRMFNGFIPSMDAFLSEEQFRKYEMWFFIAILYITPFCFGVFFSMIFRSILTSILTTFGLTMLVFLAATVVMRYNVAPYMFFPLLIGFPLASRLMVGDLLRQRPPSRCWLTPFVVFGTTSAVFLVLLLWSTLHIYLRHF